MKPIMIVRDGAIGDVVQTTPAIRWWSQQGRPVDVVTKEPGGSAVLHNSPRVRHRIEMPEHPDMKARQRLIETWRASGEWEHVIDLAGACEGRYLFHAFRPEYHWSLQFRRQIAGKARYYETLSRYAGMPEDCDDWQRPEMFPTAEERDKFANLRARFLGRKVVMLALAGSGLNKAYPWWHAVAFELHRHDPRLILLTVGGPETVPLEALVAECGADRSRLICTVQDESWTLRDSLVATAFVDVVISPETGVLNAAACWDTPKVAMLSHSNAGNLCTGWRNCFPVQSPAPCSPCYRIVAASDPCEHPKTGTDLDYSLLCMAEMKPHLVVKAAKEALRIDHSREYR